MPTLTKLVSDPENPGQMKEVAYEISQAELDARDALGRAAQAEMQAEMNRVSSRKIRESFTQDERRAIRQSTNDRVADAYEDVLTMGDYRIRRDDPKLAAMLTLLRTAVPAYPFEGLQQLIEG